MTTSSHLTADMLPAAFEQARGEAIDKEWAELVIGRFYLDGVNRTLVTDELTHVLQLVRETGEGPEQLFGEAFDYVRKQTEQWRADGAPLESAPPNTSWWDVPALAACMSTLIAVLVVTVEVLSGHWTISYTLGNVLLPLLISITAVASFTTFETLLMRTRRLWAIAGALILAVIGGSIILATLIFGNEHPLFTGSLWWYVGLAAVHVLATIAIFRYVPDGDEVRARQSVARQDRQGTAAVNTGTGDASPAEAASDDEWAAQLAGILRLRLAMPENKVRSTIAEARQHAEANGTSLVQEFGPANTYASQLPGSRSGKRLRERWRRTAWMAGIPAFGYLAFEGLQYGWEWDNVRWISAFAFVSSCIVVLGFLRKPMPQE